MGETTPSERGSIAVLALLALTQLITAVDFDIVFVALPKIGQDLGFTDQSLQAVVSAYTVTFGGLLLLGGRASDRLGARRVFIVGLAIFGLSSLAAGLANEPTTLIIARAIQGLGAALLTPSTLKLITTRFAEGHDRNRALAIWGAAGATGAAVGALGGGILTSGLGWEWVFFVNVPLVVIALIAAPRLLTADGPRLEGRGGFDLPGAILATGGATLVVLGLVRSPEIGWISSTGGGAIAVGALLLIAFVLVERRSLDPLIPGRLLRNRNLLAAVSVVFIFMGTIGTQYYLFTTYLQTVLGYSPLQAGLAFLPLSVFSVIGSAKVVPIAVAKLGIRTTLTIGLLGVSVSIAALAAGFSVGGSYLTVLPGVILWGFFAGLSFPPLFIAASTGTRPEEQGVAAALVSTSQYIGSAVGLAVLVGFANSGIPSEGSEKTLDLVVDGLTRAAWVSCGITVFGAVLATIILRKTHSSDEEPPNHVAEVSDSSQSQ